MLHSAHIDDLESLINLILDLFRTRSYEFSAWVGGVPLKGFLEAFYFILQGEMDRVRNRRRINLGKEDFSGRG